VTDSSESTAAPHSRVARDAGNEERYRYEGEAAVGRFFSGLVGVKSIGVPSGNARILTPHLEPMIIPFSEKIKVAA